MSDSLAQELVDRWQVGHGRRPQKYISLDYLTTIDGGGVGKRQDIEKDKGRGNVGTLLNERQANETNGGA